MNSPCIFCKIIKGEIPSYQVYEDDATLAFLDMNPLTKGHCLIVPKSHYENIFDIEKNALQQVMQAAQQITLRIREVLKADGVNMISNNEPIAGQKVSHFHLHIIPRYRDDQLRMTEVWHGREHNVSPEELKQIAEQLHKT